MEKIRKPLLNNWYLKIFALLVAFLLWLNLNYFERAKFELVIPVEVINLPENYKVEKIYPSKINVLVEGNIRNLSRLNFKIKAFCDASNVKIGENELPVIVQSKEKKLIIKKVEPSYIKIYIKL